MKIPRLVWDRRHNIAAVTVSYAPRIWHTREVGDLILGYNASGRLSRVVLLNPRRMLPAQATPAHAIAITIELLFSAGSLRRADHDVLLSALDRSATA
jgi:hypothetical protein